MTYEHWRERFADALDERLYPVEYLDALVASGEVVFWATETSALIFEIKEFPSGARAVTPVVAAGDVRELADVFLPQMNAWGREMGCTLSLIESREGWARLLKPRGYAVCQVSITKDL